MATTQAIFRTSKDAGQPLDITQELTASDLIRYTVPAAGGPFVTGAPQSNTLTAGAEVLLSPLAMIAANSLTDPMTIADVLLFTEVSEGGAAAQSYDDTSVAEYKVAWGGANGGSNASSSSVYVAPDDTITLEHDGDYTFDALPYQTCLSQESGTATGGTFSLKTSGGSTIASVQFPWLKRDLNYTNFPYAGGRQTIYRANMTAGTYRLGFVSHAGAGGGNRVSYNGYCHVIVRRSSLVPATGVGLADTHRSDGATAINGTVYPTDTLVFEYDDGRFKSFGVLESPLPPSTITILRETTVDGNFDFNVGPSFTVPETGTYQYVMTCQAAATQGTRTSYHFQIRTAISGGGTEVFSHYLNKDPTTSNGATVSLPIGQGTMDLVAGTDYFIFGDRNTGGLNPGNEWKLELTKV